MQCNCWTEQTNTVNQVAGNFHSSSLQNIVELKIKSYDKSFYLYMVKWNQNDNCMQTSEMVSFFFLLCFGKHIETCCTCCVTTLDCLCPPPVFSALICKHVALTFAYEFSVLSNSKFVFIAGNTSVVQFVHDKNTNFNDNADDRLLSHFRFLKCTHDAFARRETKDGNGNENDSCSRATDEFMISVTKSSSIHYDDDIATESEFKMQKRFNWLDCWSGPIVYIHHDIANEWIVN